MSYAREGRVDLQDPSRALWSVRAGHHFPATEGTHVITVRATDSAGGTTAQTLRITISWLATPAPPPPSTFSFGGFTPPVSGTTENLATAGRTLPVKFSVVGVGVDDSTVLEATFLADGATYTLLRSGGTWHVNAQTPREWAGTTGTFRVRLSDGTAHEARFRFR